MQPDMAIDLLDAKILQQLEEDSRQSHASIARRIKAPKAVVHYRIARMQEQKIISGYTYIANQGPLGIISFGVLLRFSDLLLGQEQSSLRSIRKISDVRWAESLGTGWDAIILITGKSIASFNETLKKIFRICGAHVESYQFYIEDEGWVMSHSYLYVQHRRIISAYGRGISYEMRKAERLVYERLRMHPTSSLLEVGQAIGMTYDTVKTKHQQLRDAGILLRCAPKIDPKMFGYTRYLCIMDLRPDIERTQSFLADCKADQNVIRCTRCLGHFNLLLDIHAKDAAELKEIICRLKKSYADIIRSHETIPLTGGNFG